jgi:AraC family transcriptional regulator
MLSTLYSSPLLEILRYDCAGHDSQDEEASSQHEIVLPLDGLFLRRDSFGEILADKKQILFFNANQAHEISHPAGFGESCLLIHLAEKRLLEMLPRMGNHELPFERASLHLDKCQQWQKFGLLSHLQDEAMALEASWMNWLNQIFLALYEESDNPRPLNAQQREAVHALRVMLNQDYCHALSLDELAARVHYSPFMLCRLFKQEFGLSIHQYLAELRLSEALQRLLDEPVLAIGDLGLALGYNSHSHFSAAFTKAFGFSPSEAREKLKKNSGLVGVRGSRARRGAEHESN